MDSERKFTFPEIRKLDPDAIDVSYDPHVGTLLVHFYGVNRRHFVSSINFTDSLLVDIETNEVVGVMIESFLENIFTK